MPSAEDSFDQFSREHRRAIWHIYNSANRAIYERYLLAICGHVVKAFIDNVAGGRFTPSSICI